MNVDNNNDNGGTDHNLSLLTLTVGGYGGAGQGVSPGALVPGGVGPGGLGIAGEKFKKKGANTFFFFFLVQSVSIQPWGAAVYVQVIFSSFCPLH